METSPAQKEKDVADSVRLLQKIGNRVRAIESIAERRGQDLEDDNLRFQEEDEQERDIVYDVGLLDIDSELMRIGQWEASREKVRQHFLER